MLNSALYERTQLLIGDDGINALRGTNVFLAGVGGVGGHCAEALVRSGVGRITIVDQDVVSATNKNRQLVALDSTLGQSKVQVLARRLQDINAQCVVVAIDGFIDADEMEDLLTRQRYDCVVDCIDTIECKVGLLATAVRLGLRVFASCGAGGRLDATAVRIGDLSDATNDRLASKCRYQLRRMGVDAGGIVVVHSGEKGRPPITLQRQEVGGVKSINGTMSYMPPLFGLVLASAVIQCAIDPGAHDAARLAKVKRAARKEKRAAHKAKAANARSKKAFLYVAPHTPPE